MAATEQAIIAELWHNFYAPLRGFVLKSVRNEADADDIVQEVFIKLMNHPEKLTHQHIKSYLFTIARNSVVDFHRKSDKGKHVTDEIDECNLASQELDLEAYQLADCCLQLLIDTLPPIYRAALIEVELNGMSQKNYALQLGISYTGAKSRVQRARELLYQTIMDCCQYEFDRRGNIIGIEENSLQNCKHPALAASYLDEVRFKDKSLLI